MYRNAISKLRIVSGDNAKTLAGRIMIYYVDAVATPNGTVYNLSRLEGERATAVSHVPYIIDTVTYAAGQKRL